MSYCVLLDYTGLKCGTLSVIVACQYFKQCIQSKLITIVDALLTGFRQKSEKGQKRA